MVYRTVSKAPEVTVLHLGEGLAAYKRTRRYRYVHPLRKNQYSPLAVPLFLFFKFIYSNRRLITSQNCIGLAIHQHVLWFFDCSVSVPAFPPFPISNCWNLHFGTRDGQGGLMKPISCKQEIVLVTQSRLTVCDPMDCSPPGSSVDRNSPGKILEWVTMPSSRGSSPPRDQTQVSGVASGFFTISATREAQNKKLGTHKGFLPGRASQGPAPFH